MITPKDAQRIIFARMCQDTVSAQEKAGLDFCYKIVGMIDEAAIADVLQQIYNALEQIGVKKPAEEDNTKVAGAKESPTKVAETKKTYTKAAGDKKIFKKVCAVCGKEFEAGRSAKYCKDCKVKIHRESAAKYRVKRKTEKLLDDMDAKRLARELAGMK